VKEPKVQLHQVRYQVRLPIVLLAALAVINNACLLTCDMSSTVHAVMWTQVATISDVGFHAT